MLLLVACSSGPAPADHLTLAGSSTIQPLAELAGQAFEATHPGVRVDVQGGGSAVGISATRSGLADIGTVSRALTAGEADLVATPIALDGVAIIVHATNPVSGLRRDQVVSLYTGATRSWAELGGDERPVTLVNKEEGRATRELFEGFFELEGRFDPSAVIIGPNGQALTTVAGNPAAVAYVSIGSAAYAEAQGTPIRRLALDGVAATVEHVADGSYPLMRPLNLVTRGAPTGIAREFVDFVLSPAGRALVEKEDFVPVRRDP